MKVLITGSRYWSTDEHIVKIVNELEKLPAGSIIVHGAAPGVDTIADVVARELNFDVRPYPADWVKEPKRAGPIRNREMLVKEHLEHEPIELVIAFHDDIMNSRGTKDMIGIARKAMIETKLIV